jgi:predicted ATP-grasp superfamily ATP-dependent carboligase
MVGLPNLDSAYPAMIFKASRDTLHHGALSIARTLGQLGVPVFALTEDRYTPVAISRYLTKAFVWKEWPNDNAALLDAMSAIGTAIRHPSILIPMDDLSAVFVAENAQALGEWFRVPQLASDLPRQLANKASLFSLCAKIGVPCPKTVVPHGIEDVHNFIEQTTFPVVVKAAEQWLLLDNRFSAIVVPTREALTAFYERTKPEERSRIILQEFIKGKDWIYHGYCNPKVELYVSFTGENLRSYPPNAGSTALGVSCMNKDLCRQSEKLLKSISYAGITDMDWRYDERDGQYKMLDCNPRVGMNFRLFENHSGIDVVRAQHLDLTGRAVNISEMIEGRFFSVESFYFLASARGWRLGAFEAKVNSRPLDRERAWWRRDDPRPFFVMSIRLLFRTVKRVLQQGIRYAPRLTEKSQFGLQCCALHIVTFLKKGWR